MCVSVCVHDYEQSEPSPGIVHQGTDYTKTDKPSPGTSLEATRRQTTLSVLVCVLKDKPIPGNPSWGTRVCVHMYVHACVWFAILSTWGASGKR